MVGYRDVEIGKVRSIDLGDGTAVATLGIDDDVRVPARVSAGIRSKSAIGEQSVNLTPSGDGPPWLEPGDRITDTTSLPRTDELITSLDDLAASIPHEELNVVLDELTTGLRGKDPQVTTLLENTRTVLHQAGLNLEPTVGLIAELGLFLRTQRDIAPETRSTLGDLASFSEQLRPSDGDLRGVLARTPPAAEELIGLQDRLIPALPQLLADLDATGQVVRTQLPGVSQTLVLYPAMTAALQRVVQQPGAAPTRASATPSTARRPAARGTRRCRSSAPSTTNRPRGHLRTSTARSRRTIPARSAERGIARAPTILADADRPRPRAVHDRRRSWPSTTRAPATRCCPTVISRCSVTWVDNGEGSRRHGDLPGRGGRGGAVELRRHDGGRARRGAGHRRQRGVTGRPAAPVPAADHLGEDRRDLARRQPGVRAMTTAEVVEEQEVVEKPGRRRIATALVVVVLLAGSAAVVFLHQRQDAAARVAAARAAATEVATRRIPEVLSCSHESLDRDLAAAERAVTGGFARDYLELQRTTIRPAAVRDRISTRTTLSALGVTATDRRVVLPAFINQLTTSSRQPAPLIEGARVRVTMEKVGDDWLMSTLDTV
ncbi:MCE family protein [Saccharopolyspora aridisoli]|uniref:MCE family protein n=2 Tax=Saccharopolyspora aridisoli TaxID=2530385 RepID=A0A4R4UT39_9PSEU|nr:MCE family protein [Saccharopolyspora aridisoli]